MNPGILSSLILHEVKNYWDLIDLIGKLSNKKQSHVSLNRQTAIFHFKTS